MSQLRKKYKPETSGVKNVRENWGSLVSAIFPPSPPPPPPPTAATQAQAWSAENTPYWLSFDGEDVGANCYKSENCESELRCLPPQWESNALGHAPNTSPSGNSWTCTAATCEDARDGLNSEWTSSIGLNDQQIGECCVQDMDCDGSVLGGVVCRAGPGSSTFDGGGARNNKTCQQETCEAEWSRAAWSNQGLLGWHDQAEGECCLDDNDCDGGGVISSSGNVSCIDEGGAYPVCRSETCENPATMNAWSGAWGSTAGDVEAGQCCTTTSDCDGEFLGNSVCITPDTVVNTGGITIQTPTTFPRSTPAVVATQDGLGYGLCHAVGAGTNGVKMLGIRVYDGYVGNADDNPGSLASALPGPEGEQIRKNARTVACGNACVNQSTPLANGTWENRGPATGFSVIASDLRQGRCYCAHRDMTVSNCDNIPGDRDHTHLSPQPSDAAMESGDYYEAYDIIEGGTVAANTIGDSTAGAVDGILNNENIKVCADVSCNSKSTMDEWQNNWFNSPSWLGQEPGECCVSNSDCASGGICNVPSGMHALQADEGNDTNYKICEEAQCDGNNVESDIWGDNFSLLLDDDRLAGECCTTDLQCDDSFSAFGIGTYKCKVPVDYDGPMIVEGKPQFGYHLHNNPLQELCDDVANPYCAVNGSSGNNNKVCRADPQLGIPGEHAWWSSKNEGLIGIGQPCLNDADSLIGAPTVCDYRMNFNLNPPVKYTDAEGYHKVIRFRSPLEEEWVPTVSFMDGVEDVLEFWNWGSGDGPQQPGEVCRVDEHCEDGGVGGGIMCGGPVLMPGENIELVSSVIGGNTTCQQKACSRDSAIRQEFHLWHNWAEDDLGWGACCTHDTQCDGSTITELSSGFGDYMTKCVPIGIDDPKIYQYNSVGQPIMSTLTDLGDGGLQELGRHKWLHSIPAPEGGVDAQLPALSARLVKHYEALGGGDAEIGVTKTIKTCRPPNCQMNREWNADTAGISPIGSCCRSNKNCQGSSDSDFFHDGVQCRPIMMEMREVDGVNGMYPKLDENGGFIEGPPVLNADKPAYYQGTCVKPGCYDLDWEKPHRLDDIGGFDLGECCNETADCDQIGGQFFTTIYTAAGLATGIGVGLVTGGIGLGTVAATTAVGAAVGSFFDDMVAECPWTGDTTECEAGQPIQCVLIPRTYVNAYGVVVPMRAVPTAAQIASWGQEFIGEEVNGEFVAANSPPLLNPNYGGFCKYDPGQPAASSLPDDICHPSSDQINTDLCTDGGGSNWVSWKTLPSTLAQSPGYTIHTVDGVNKLALHLTDVEYNQLSSGDMLRYVKDSAVTTAYAGLWNNHVYYVLKLPVVGGQYKIAFSTTYQKALDGIIDQAHPQQATVDLNISESGAGHTLQKPVGNGPWTLSKKYVNNCGTIERWADGRGTCDRPTDWDHIRVKTKADEGELCAIPYYGQPGGPDYITSDMCSNWSNFWSNRCVSDDFTSHMYSPRVGRCVSPESSVGYIQNLSGFAGSFGMLVQDSLTSMAEKMVDVVQYPGVAMADFVSQISQFVCNFATGALIDAYEGGIEIAAETMAIAITDRLMIENNLLDHGAVSATTMELLEADEADLEKDIEDAMANGEITVAEQREIDDAREKLDNDFNVEKKRRKAGQLIGGGISHGLGVILGNMQAVLIMNLCEQFLTFMLDWIINTIAGTTPISDLKQEDVLELIQDFIAKNFEEKCSDLFLETARLLANDPYYSTPTPQDPPECPVPSEETMIDTESELYILGMDDPPMKTVHVWENPDSVYSACVCPDGYLAAADENGSPCYPSTGASYNSVGVNGKTGKAITSNQINQLINEYQKEVCDSMQTTEQAPLLDEFSQPVHMNHAGDLCVPSSDEEDDCELVMHEVPVSALINPDDPSNPYTYRAMFSTPGVGFNGYFNMAAANSNVNAAVGTMQNDPISFGGGLANMLTCGVATCNANQYFSPTAGGCKSFGDPNDITAVLPSYQAIYDDLQANPDDNAAQTAINDIKMSLAFTDVTCNNVQAGGPLRGIIGAETAQNCNSMQNYDSLGRVHPLPVSQTTDGSVFNPPLALDLPFELTTHASRSDGGQIWPQVAKVDAVGQTYYEPLFTDQEITQSIDAVQTAFTHVLV